MIIIKEYINVKDERLIDGLTPVVRIMSQMEDSNDLEVTIDFSDTRFISPVFALSFIVYLSRCGKQVSFKNISDYLERIEFSNGGVKPDMMRQTEFLADLEKYASKTYIPIIDFAAGRNSDAKEAVSSIVENMIIQQLSIQSNVANGLKYMIDEILDNITEHSESDRGYIFAQAYPTKGFLDVCIADRGVSLLGSYEKLPGNEILSDIEAIKAANRGLSSKNLPDAENRGFGIRTSKQMLIQGLGGQYLMISGSSLYIKTVNLDSFYSMPRGLRWNGTIVALRIPYHSSSFNYINYIE
jgi:anti-sigma regulatory factor (Ser/Thr protein kinase)